MSYLRARATEWESWAGLLVLAIIGAWCWHNWRVEIHHFAEAGVAAIIAAVPRKAPEMVSCFLRRLISKPVTSSSLLKIKESDMTTWTDILAAAEAEEQRLLSEAKTAVDAFLETHLGTNIAQLGAEAATFYSGYQAAKSADTAKAWAQFVSQTAETIDAQAKQIAAMQAAVPAPGPQTEPAATGEHTA